MKRRILTALLACCLSLSLAVPALAASAAPASVEEASQVVSAPVSYTHLDVYKRQVCGWNGNGHFVRPDL